MQEAMENGTPTRILIAEAREKADKELALLRSCSCLTYPFFRKRFRSIVLAKYLLEEDELPPGDLFDDIVKISIAKTMRVSAKIVADLEAASSCDGATSVMAKKVLLLMSIQKELGIELPATESARISTLDDLAALTWKAMGECSPWKEIMRQ